MIVVELMENGDLLNYLQVLKTRDNRYHLICSNNYNRVAIRWTINYTQADSVVY